MSKKDYENFKKSLVGIYSKGDSNQVTFIFNPNKLMRGSGILQDGTKFFIGFTTGVGLKVSRDLYNIMSKVTSEEQTYKEAKETAKKYYSEKYGTAGKFLKNFLGSLEVVSLSLSPIAYKAFLDKLPQNSFTDFFKNSLKKAERFGARQDIRFGFDKIKLKDNPNQMNIDYVANIAKNYMDVGERRVTNKGTVLYGLTKQDMIKKLREMLGSDKKVVQQPASYRPASNKKSKIPRRAKLIEDDDIDSEEGDMYFDEDLEFLDDDDIVPSPPPRNIVDSDISFAEFSDLKNTEMRTILSKMGKSYSVMPKTAIMIQDFQGLKQKE